MAFFSTTSGVAVVDTRTRQGTITLPLTSQIPNRYLQLKDLYGAFGRSSLTVSTQTGESFDDGTTTKIFSDPFTFLTLYAASTSKWAQLGGTQTIQQTMSSLNVSSVYGSSFNTLFLNASTLSQVTILPSPSNLWVAAGYDLVSPTLNMKYSTDGITWVTASGATFSSSGQGVGYNGSMWVAVGTDSTSNNTIKYSYDGRTWSNCSSGGFGSAQGGFGVAWNGRLWVVVGNGTNTVKYSGDGINWSNGSGGFSSSGYGVAWNGYMFVAGGVDTLAANSIKYSYDGINWSNSASGGFVGGGGLNVAWNGRMWVIAGADSTPAAMLKYSTDGINWSNSVSGSFSIQARGIAWNGRMWVAVGNDTVCMKYSYDGMNWSNAASGAYVSGAGFGVAWNGTMWVAIGQDATQNNGLKYSYDGINWLNSLGAGFNQYGWAVAYSSNQVPSYAQRYFEIQPQGIPLFTRSTNTMTFTPSTMILNNALTIDGVSDRVGINTGFPQADLDVAGVGRFSSLSTILLNGFPPVLPPQLISTTFGLQTSGFISSPNLLNMVSTPFLNTTLQSTTTGISRAGFVSSANLLTLVSTPFLDTTLQSTTTGISRAGFVSSPNLLNLVSTTFLNSALASTVGGLVTRIPDNLSTSAFFTSSILASTITTSSLQVNSLTIGTGTGWVNLGPLQTVAISSIQTNANDTYTNNLFIGIQSTLNDIQFYGLLGNYNNTALAEVSTGAGTQELLVFKGSSVSDRVRVQTTGTFVVETGVSSRLFNTNTTQTQSNVTPAMIINSSSNVGIQTATPGATLDVAGSGRFQGLSTLNINVSTINGQVVGNLSSFVASSIQATVGTISSLTVNSLQVGDGTGWLSMGPIQALAVSTVQGNANINTTVTTSTLALNISSINGGRFPSIFVSQGKLNADETITANADAIIPFVSDFDPNSWLANAGTSSARVIPTVAGYYMVTFQVWWARGSGTGQVNMQIRKGSAGTISIVQNQINTIEGMTQTTTKIAYMNGSTDYVDFTVYTSTTDPTQNIQYGGTGNGGGTFYSVSLIR